ncbi:hypothetical protein Q3G72_004063 [Acer saccharum]|nr:hypothetical protein Q3G72_004063 [Acer saccharum]
MMSWPSKYSPVTAKNHWFLPGFKSLVSVPMDPGGPHLSILPLTDSAISVTVQMGELMAFEGEEKSELKLKS